ncbi:MAG TPA: hypothetical protein VG076_09845 [Acidimicrobiales bacterium]|jgi:hypothetical protein|nr:hypothetical protein [Acidimicrobiales bacterium]
MTSSLRALDRQLLFVRRLLTEDGDDARSRAEAIRLLRDVERCVRRWAAEAPSRALAARLLRVESELRRHLVAASTLEEVGQPPRGAAGMLKRAVDTTRIGLRGVVRIEHPAGQPAARN